MRNKFLILSASLILFAANAFGQSGGGYEITQSVIASGGGQNSAGGTFSLNGTIGQAVAGNAATGAPFSVTSGFWNFTPLTPTAAMVSVSGRVTTAAGRGIRNVSVSLTNQTGEIRTARTDASGYFQFDNAAVGETYIFMVSSKHYTFRQPTQIWTIFEELGDIVFVADF